MQIHEQLSHQTNRTFWRHLCVVRVCVLQEPMSMEHTRSAILKAIPVVGDTVRTYAFPPLHCVHSQPHIQLTALICRTLLSDCCWMSQADHVMYTHDQQGYHCCRLLHCTTCCERCIAAQCNEQHHFHAVMGLSHGMCLTPAQYHTAQWLMWQCSWSQTGEDPF